MDKNLLMANSKRLTSNALPLSRAGFYFSIDEK